MRHEREFGDQVVRAHRCDERREAVERAGVEAVQTVAGACFGHGLAVKVPRLKAPVPLFAHVDHAALDGRHVQRGHRHDHPVVEAPHERFVRDDGAASLDARRFQQQAHALGLRLIRLGGQHGSEQRVHGRRIEAGAFQ